VGSRSCMGCLSRQREHSGNGQGRTRAPPAAYQFRRLGRRQADAPTDRARRLAGLKRNFGMVVTAAAGMTSTSPLAVWHVRRAKGGITTVHPIGAKKSQALRQLQREKARPPWPPSPREKRPGAITFLGGRGALLGRGALPQYESNL
jgi:hypothetical protein